MTSVSLCVLCASIHVCAYVCTCMWKPEDTLKCYYLGTIYPVFEMGSFTDPEFSKLARLSGQ